MTCTVSGAAAALAAQLRLELGDALQAVLFYGSVLRDGDDEEGLIDLLAVVDGYRAAYRGLKLAALNKILPPNVFYREVRADDRTYRMKFAVVSAGDLARYTRARCLQSYFWGRFSQPCALAFARSDVVAESIARIRAEAVRTFIRQTLPLMPASFTAEELWIRGLAASYGTELRPERDGRAQMLIERDLPRYRRLTAAVAAAGGLPFVTSGDTQGDGMPYSNRVRSFARWTGRQRWRVRCVQGKALNVARIIKAGVFTFEGGVDYILWKVRRHSGVEIEVSDRVRRHPWIAGLPVLWRLYRKGAFR
jgi:hypothetical protein